MLRALRSLNKPASHLKRFLSSPAIIILGCTAAVFYLAGVPILMLLFGSLRSAPIGEPGAVFTLNNYTSAYGDIEFYVLFWNSLKYAAGTSVFTLAIGTYLAWISERTNTPFRKAFVVMALVPYLIPGIVDTIAWILLLSPKIGLVNLTLMQLLGLSSPPFNIYSIAGMIWVEAIHDYPIVFLLMSAGFRSTDPSLEEASMVAGSGIWTTFKRITLPVLRPAMLSVLLLMFVRGIEAFEVPALVGSPAGIYLFTTKIYFAITGFPSDLGLAGTYAVSVMIVSVIGIVLYQKATKSGERYVTITGRGYRPRVLDLGAWRWVTLSTSLAIFFTAVVLPLVVLLWASLVPFYAVPSREMLAKMSFDNYLFVINYPRALAAFKNSMLLSIGTATFTMLLTSVIAWITVRSEVRGRGVLESVTFLPITIPGIVLGVSLIWVYLMLPVPVYGTLWILLIAYVTRNLPYGIRAATGSMVQISKELEEASHISGASWIQTFGRVVIPLLLPGFMAGWIYISIVSLRELSTSILLYSHDSIVMSILAFDLWDGGQYQYVAALGILMVLIMTGMATVARLFGARFGIAQR